jgi:4-amino-4-deoxy-L-arabinose transferase-like glycosyltransferase
MMEADRLGDISTRTLTVKTAFVLVMAFALYFFSRSPGLDEIDSVSFAMGVREFNIWIHQPHPPGYPLYIFLGWIGAKCFGWSPDFSLHVVSAFGGALFVAAWFVIIRLEFSERLGWWIAGCLAITPAVWMTSTKVLTDSLAAGFLGVQLIAALIYVHRGGTRALIATGLFGAAATGARPQMIAVVLAVLITALAGRRAKLKTWLLGLATFFGSCMLWLVPMLWSQTRLRRDVPAWLVYPQLLYGQWQWRLDKPHVYLGAGDWSLKYLGQRFFQHIFGWLGVGFGFVQSPGILVAGVVIVIVALVAYWFSKREISDRSFWRFHSAWALVHIAIIFVCLPASQRYYIVIYPLLLVALLRGLLHMPKPWNLSALALPVLLLYIDIPIASANHRDDPPDATCALSGKTLSGVAAKGCGSSFCQRQTSRTMVRSGVRHFPRQSFACRPAESCRACGRDLRRRSQNPFTKGLALDSARRISSFDGYP